MGSKILRSRILWILTLAVFVLLVRDSIANRRAVRNEIETLRMRRDYYLERIREDSTVIEKLRDDDFLEQYAREHFLMRRDDETVYVLERPVVLED
ncbi:MAG: septum formation initiator family protein [Rikenellaceae bacterium]|nr:septum formation initiator family protein [Rikenellaceae bacterium]MCL2692689.1 septum formation initiator family protein [Rikenellaceae bacterium]